MQEFLHGGSMVILYLIPMAIMALTARKLIKIVPENIAFHFAWSIYPADYGF